MIATPHQIASAQTCLAMTGGLSLPLFIVIASPLSPVIATFLLSLRAPSLRSLRAERGNPSEAISSTSLPLNLTGREWVGAHNLMNCAISHQHPKMAPQLVSKIPARLVDKPSRVRYTIDRLACSSTMVDSQPYRVTGRALQDSYSC